MFNKWQAQRWWAENYDKVMELYNVQRFNQTAPLYTTPKSEDKVSKLLSLPFEFFLQLHTSSIINTAYFHGICFL
jgi:hypothetical protein